MQAFLLIFLAVVGSWATVIEETNKTNVTFSSNDTFPPPEVYIVGGVRATPNEFPWLVNLRIDRGFCGGAIIDWNLVLTAAHCLVGENGNQVSADKITVFAGDDDLRDTTTREQRLTASAALVHENYNSPRQFANDIALIRLSKKLNSTQYVTTIGMPPPGNSSATNGTVAGWGTLSDGGTTVSNLLYKVTVPIVTDQTCRNLMTNPTGQFCAGQTGKDSCQGDSGGPFMCTNAPKEVCGIVSYGIGCGSPGNPGVYTKVSNYVSWIQKNFNFTEGSNFTPKPSSTPNPNSSATSLAYGMTVTVAAVYAALLSFSPKFLTM